MWFLDCDGVRVRAERAAREAVDECGSIHPAWWLFKGMMGSFLVTPRSWRLRCWEDEG